jgi:hypothetical protein
VGTSRRPWPSLRLGPWPRPPLWLAASSPLVVIYSLRPFAEAAASVGGLWSGPHAGSAGKTLRWRHRPALGGLERGSRRTALWRHPPGGPERARQLHVVLPEPDPALRRQGSAQGGDPGAIRIRRGLRRVFGPGAEDSNGKQVVAASVARYIARISERVGFQYHISLEAVSTNTTSIPCGLRVCASAEGEFRHA